MTHRRLSTASLLVGALMLVTAEAGCRRAPAPTPTPVAPVASITNEPRDESGFRPAGDAVVASGEIVPAQKAPLAFTVAGRVRAVTVSQNEKVQAEQVLVTLETTRLEADVQQAEAALAAAQAQLALLEAAPRPEEVEAAEARLETAQATVAQAAARRDQLTSGATEAEIAAARAALADARVEEKVARDTFDLLEPNAADWQREVTKLRLWAAEKARVAAEAELALTERGAEVQMRDARAALWAASAQRDTAQAELDLLRADPVAEEIAAAEAEVSRARAGLAAAQAALDQATLRAPFDGVVTGLETSPGEMVMPGQAVLTLADLDRLQVETTDLSERDVIQVAPGQPATVYVEGLDVEIEGRVARITPRATTIGGDVVYTVVVELDERPSGLRWGMSVEVEITTG